MYAMQHVTALSSEVKFNETVTESGQFLDAEMHEVSIVM